MKSFWAGRAKKHTEVNPFFALLIILVIATIFSNIIPSGMYERLSVDGRMVVAPESFQYVDKQYVGISDFFLSFYQGFNNAASLMAMLFFAGGAFGVVKRIGLLETAIKALALSWQNCLFTQRLDIGRYALA